MSYALPLYQANRDLGFRNQSGFVLLRPGSCDVRARFE